jgi:sigma-B regulation protein RsbU (phosphoserine phosphatase)
LRILVVEDDVVVRRLLRGHLESCGHEVTQALDGAEAWELVRHGHFPVVISDWMMPGIDGLELIRRIRSSAQPSYVYVILLTGKSQREDFVTAMEAGADDFVPKPFDRDELRVRLRSAERIIELERRLAGRNEELQALNAGLSAANERMRRDLGAAARVQRALLPTALPEVDGVRFAWAFKPCEELAGDILNVVRLDDRHVGLYVLDVCGHGVASALLSVTVSRFLSSVPDSSSLILRRVEGTPDYALVPAAEVAAQLNRRFLFNVATEQYFTMIYGILDLESRQFRYISAGHPALVHVPAGAPAAILEAPGFPIGITVADYQEHVVRLRPGDRLYLYSDGVVEAKDDRQRLFGTRGLADFLDGGRATPLGRPSPTWWVPSSVVGTDRSTTTSRSWPWRSRPPATPEPERRPPSRAGRSGEDSYDITLATHPP